MRNMVIKSLMFAAMSVSLMSCGGSAGSGNSEVSAEKDTVVPSGVETRVVDNLMVSWVKDNDGNKLMPPSLFGEKAKSLIDSLGLQEGIPASVSTFLVDLDSVKILFDAGLGNPDSHLLEGLQSLGVAPDDVRYIYLTHLHGDHIGGLINDGKAVFPNADIYVSKPEYDGWMSMEADKKAQVVAVSDAYNGRMHLFSFGETLPGGVKAMDAVGHTPGHTVYQVGKLLVVGDLMHGASLQMVNSDICASYDMDADGAVKTRRHYLEYARDNDLVMAGMHFPEPAFLEF